MICIYQQEHLNLSDFVRSALEKHLSQQAQDAGFFRVPADCYNGLRKQYDAGGILAVLASRKDGCDLKIGVVDVDIYAPGMNFIFGLADPVQKAALVSTFRLEGDNTMERISKEVVHEIGHLLGIGHCSNKKCVMHFSNTVHDTDYKEVSMCHECRRNIE